MFDELLYKITVTSCDKLMSVEQVFPSSRLTKDTIRFKDELDIMKFICKDFWTCVFKKQIDNLRTNHQVTLSSLLVTDCHSHSRLQLT